MGLEIIVGHLADLTRHDEEAATWYRAVLADLNLVLAEAGEAPHHEPDEISDGSQSWELLGYSGLHHVRRLASWLAIEQQLPPPVAYGEAAGDLVLRQFYNQHKNHLRYRSKTPELGFAPSRSPKFQHLMLHSDVEGFYLPRTFPEVIFDFHSPPREGIGAMVGSAERLLKECRELADAHSLPPGTDPEGEEVYRNLEIPPGSGQPWQRLPIETFVVTRLIAACEKSLETGAAVVFA
jgi:hypothetical protein